jgi:hypothetical protein
MYFTANRQPPTANRQPPTTNHQPPTTNHKQQTANVQVLRERPSSALVARSADQLCN